MRCLFGWQVGWHGKKCRTVFLTVFVEEKWGYRQVRSATPSPPSSVLGA